MSYVSVFSVPDDIPATLGKAALEAALELFCEIDKRPPKSVKDQQFIVYRAYLGAMGRLSIGEHVVAAVSRSYLKFNRADMLPKSNRCPEHQHMLFEKQIV